MPQELIQSPVSFSHVPEVAQPPDRFASQLMDEIFGDVEDVLDGGFVPPKEPLKVEMPRPEIQFDVAAALAERYPQLARHLEEGEALPDLPTLDTALSTPKEKASKKKKEKNSGGLGFLERLMIFTGCTSAVAALGIWMTSQGLFGRLATMASSTGSPVAQTPALDEAQVRFADYMLRSLAAIDRNGTTANGATANGAVGTTTAALPVGAIPGAEKPSVISGGVVLPKPAALGVAVPPSVLPVRPLNLPQQPVNPVATNPDTVSRGEFNRVNQMLSKISGMLERISPGSSSRIPGWGRSAPKAAVVAAPKSVATAAQPVVTNQPQRIVTSYGVVPNGGSFVFFDVNGVQVRVSLGEAVGSTGWTLIEVTDSGIATFRRNGEIRKVAQGEKL
jgi:hypothetical protein